MSDETEEMPLVGIGASAGGLEPLEKFFNAIDKPTGIAYVVIQHLSPDYRSMMDELLARKSSMRIVHIRDGLTLRPNTVYLNSPNTYVELEGNTFRTEPYTDNAHLPHLPIDRFFSSLVERDPNRTVAIVMSGSGSDGSQGARLLHACGAAVLVQSIKEATFSSMPRTTLLSGQADKMLDAADMPATIQDILTYGKANATEAKAHADSDLVMILNRLESRHQIDFRNYKSANVNRRILRRAHLRGLVSIQEYAELLRSDDDAVDELFEDMLIGVTEFYRDPLAIETLRNLVLNKLATGDESAPPIKIWIPACASGKEVYTLAIEMNEALIAAGSTRRFRIIGTDVYGPSIEIASRGQYPVSELDNMPPNIAERYFSIEGEVATIDPSIRQKIIFSVHDLLADPPFTSLDLVSCRNLLIYLKEEPQANVISMFLFGLKQDGHLLLGSSESVGKFASAFSVADARWRLFRKTMDQEESRQIWRSGMWTTTKPVQAPPLEPSPRSFPASPITPKPTRPGLRSQLVQAYDVLLKTYAPSSILMTLDGSVLSWFGAAGSYIDTKNNLADWTLNEIVHPDLRFLISAGLERVRQGQMDVSPRSVEVALGTSSDKVNLIVDVEALSDGLDTPLVLVRIKPAPDGAVEEAPVESQVDMVPPPQAPDKSSQDGALLINRIHVLENDLRTTEETLQHVTERLEASSEELQASNEELQASNEELQASNEELQSSNEELHAVNEELITVSSEHERKIEELSELNANTEIVLKMLNAGLLLVDGSNRIRRFSRLIEQDFLMQSYDIGRSIMTVGPRLDFADLAEMREALFKSREIQRKDGLYNGRALTVEARIVSVGPEETESDAAMFLFRWD